jgi:AcrR family transcriptional regulator
VTEPSAEAPLVRTPKQARSARTLARLEEAALALIREEGVEGVSIQGIVKRAGSSVGSFYARFAGKDDLLVHLRAQVTERGRAQWRQEVEEIRAADLDLESLLERVCAAVTGVFHGMGREAVLLRSGPSAEEEAGLVEEITGTLTSLLVERSSEVVAEDTGRAIRFSVRSILAVGRDLGRSSDETLEQLVPELARSQVRYLAGSAIPSPSESPQGSAPDPFDIWG